MRKPFSAIVLLGAFLGAAANAQDASSQKPDSRLPAVRITQPVTANGQPLAPGTYEIRITAERPALPSGAPSDTQRWVEFIAGGTVVAREIAEVIPAEGSSPGGTSSATAPPRTIVQLLKEGDFVRVSIWESGLRYLIYLPTGKPAAVSGPAK